MRSHAQTAERRSSGGRPEWIDRAHRIARSAAFAERGTYIETREERNRKGELKAIVAETRTDVPVPAALKDVVKSLFTKTNVATVFRGQEPCETVFRGRTLVVTFKRPQNGIRGLPVRKAEERKLRKIGFTHMVINRLPESARLDAASYMEGGWWMGFYKPKGGKRQRGDRGGELVYEVQDELCVLQFIYENGLRALYESPYLTSWKFLPVTDDQRERDNGVANMVAALFGRGGRAHPEGSYHRARLIRRFEDIFSSSDCDDGPSVAERALEAFRKTVIGHEAIRRYEAGTFEVSSFYVSSDGSTAYAIHNVADGQYVVKVHVPTRSVEIGLVKQDLNGLKLMELYDDFLRSSDFHEIPASEYAARTRGIRVISLC